MACRRKGLEPSTTGEPNHYLLDARANKPRFGRIISIRFICNSWSSCSFDALHEGKTISDMTKSGRPSYILNHRALLLFRQKHPKFERFVVRLSTANAKIHHAEASARRAQIFGAPAIAEHGADIFMLIRSAVPTTLPAQIRDDVIGAMTLEVVEGKLKTADIRRRVREFITAQYRQFSRFGPRSLDARVFEDGMTTLGDTISRGLWD
jgi:hypothetical protein